MMVTIFGGDGNDAGLSGPSFPSLYTPQPNEHGPAGPFHLAAFPPLPFRQGLHTVAFAMRPPKRGLHTATLHSHCP